ncbi:hypothetical protein C0J52_22777, partial [Blattella germanica]
SKVFAASSLWCTYSKLKTILRVREKVDVSSFTNVVSFLKKMSVRHVPRKSNVLSRSQIDEFLLNAPDDVFLLIKVVTAFGVFGAYRRQELHDLCFNDVKVEGSVLVVLLRQRAQATEIEHLATSKKWKWGGHVTRLQNNRWTYKTTVWDPRIGKRTQGRPRRRWADLFKEHAGCQWSRLARKREQWRRLEYQLCSD